MLTSVIHIETKSPVPCVLQKLNEEVAEIPGYQRLGIVAAITFNMGMY